MSGNKIVLTMKTYAFIILIIFLLAFLFSCTAATPKTDPSFTKLYTVNDKGILSVVEGGRLYDTWWVEIDGVKEPETTHPLWSLQTTNTRQGSATWRCKECHGWDYKGKDGVYKTGSHRTGFPGIFNSQNLPLNDIESILRGSTHQDHDFSNVLDAGSIANLAAFIKNGLVDVSVHIDHKNKRPLSANVKNGLKLYDVTKCSHCHGAKGANLNFGSNGQKEYIGTVAKSNPWEFIHKVRFGQPGEIMPPLNIDLKLPEGVKRMPSGTQVGYTLQDVLDILEYARTLPVE
jgi:thiosulfate dehydrogenase